MSDASSDASTSPEAIAFIQANGLGGTSTTTVSVSLAARVQAHHAIIVAVTAGGSGATLTSLQDTLTQSLTKVVGPVIRGDGSWLSVYFAADVPEGTESVTATVAKDASYFDVYVHEYAGISAFDVGAGLVGTQGGDVSTQPVKTTGTRDLVFGFGISGTMGVGPGFTARSTYDKNITEDRIQDGPANVVASGVADSSWGLVVAAFK